MFTASPPSPLSPPRRRDEEGVESIGQLGGVEESGSLFETRDVVELSESTGASQLTEGESGRPGQLVLPGGPALQELLGGTLLASAGNQLLERGLTRVE